MRQQQMKHIYSAKAGFQEPIMFQPAFSLIVRGIPAGPHLYSTGRIDTIPVACRHEIDTGVNIDAPVWVEFQIRVCRYPCLLHRWEPPDCVLWFGK